MLEYVQAIDRALRPMLANSTEPLILAAAEPLIGIFRGASSYPHVVEQVITGNPEEKTDEELAQAARLVLDAVYAQKIAALKEDFEARIAAGTALVDLSDIARAATYGAVEALDRRHRPAGARNAGRRDGRDHPGRLRMRPETTASSTRSSAGRWPRRRRSTRCGPRTFRAEEPSRPRCASRCWPVCAGLRLREQISAA